jgi:hypothetical protein
MRDERKQREREIYVNSLELILYHLELLLLDYS